VRDAVVGIGLFQGLEFLLSHSTWEVASRAGVVSRRFSSAFRIALTSQT
jgi:hypothetical protein